MINKTASSVDQPFRAFRSLAPSDLRRRVKLLAKTWGSLQLPTRGDNVFIFSTPRSGSTWLAEMILSQPSFRDCDQPFDIRNDYVREKLGISTWDELYNRDSDRLLQPYLQAVCDGRLRGLTTLGNRGRLISRRLAFKIQNGWQERIGWMQEKFGGKVVILLRHPIAVTLSRKQFPRLEAFLKSTYARKFDKDVLAMAKRIAETGSHFEKGILHWCFETALPLRQIEGDWIIIAYEELVSDPEPVINRLAGGLNLPEPKLIMNKLSIPSRTTWKSTADTRKMVASDDRKRLISKWRDRVSEAEECQAFEIVEAFGIDAYCFGRDMPAECYLIGSGGAAA